MIQSNQLKWVRTMVLALCLFLTGPKIIQTGIEWYADFTRPYPQLWMDEGLVVEPIMSIYRDGYWGYRCRDGVNACYGGTQSFIDASVLKIVPPQWLQKESLHLPPGIRWPWNLEYPRMQFVLLGVRLAYALGLILAIMFLGLKLGFDFSVLTAAGMLTSVTIISSWQGIKNDFAFGFWLLLYLWWLNQVFRIKHTEARYLAFLSSLVIGVLGISVKPTMVLAVVLAVSYYSLFYIFFENKIKGSIVKLTLIAIVSFAVLLISNPNMFHSAFEARWLLLMLQMAKQPLNIEKIRSEILSNLHIFWLFGALLITYGCVLKQNPIRYALKRWGYFILLSMGFAFVTFKCGYGRPPYHLPAFLTLIITTLFMLRETQTKGWICVLILGLSLSFYQGNHAPYTAWANIKFNPRPRLPIDVLLNHAREAKDYVWWIDRSLRAPIRKDSLDESQIHYFDSLSDSPMQVLREIDQFELSGDKREVRVITTCWKQKNAEDFSKMKSGLYSPAGLAWGALLNNKCQGFHPIQHDTVEAYINAFVPNSFYVLKKSEIKQQTSVKFDFDYSHELHPRMFTGSFNGVDHWDMPYMFKKSVALKAEFQFEQGLTKVEVPVWSSCKTDASIRVLVKTRKHTQSTKSISLNVRGQFCEKYNWACSFDMDWFLKWAHPRFVPGEPVVLDVNIDANEQAQLEIYIDKNLNEECFIEMHKLTLH